MNTKKECDICSSSTDKLFRCRYNHKKAWVFLCQTCLTKIKIEFSESYQYGGTKKIKQK